MGVSNPGAGAASQPLAVGTVTPIDPAGTPSLAVTPTVPQTLTASIPTGGTKVQKTVIPTNASGVATWTFPSAFQNPPSMAITCEGDGTTQATANITAISATSVTIKVFKASVTLNAILGINIMIPLATPGVTNVHLYAAPNPN